MSVIVCFAEGAEHPIALETTMFIYDEQKVVKKTLTQDGIEFLQSKNKFCKECGSRHIFLLKYCSECGERRKDNQGKILIPD